MRFLVFAFAIVAVAGCDRSASERPTEKTIADRADAAAAPKPSAGTVSSNDKVTDAGAAKAP